MEGRGVIRAKLEEWKGVPGKWDRYKPRYRTSGFSLMGWSTEMPCWTGSGQERKKEVTKQPHTFQIEVV